MSDEPNKTVKESQPTPISSTTPGAGEDLLQAGIMQQPDQPGMLGKIGRFDVIRLIGQGGMGQVLLAREPVTNVTVAIKALKPHLARDAASVHRFLTEARHAYAMGHPHILKVMEVSDSEDQPFYVVPYIEGGSLARRIGPQRPLPPETVLAIAQQIASALSYAHGRGIIHRDLKPANVLVDGEGRAYLTDFGLLRTVFNDSFLDVQQSSLEGTAPYMSPAMVQGKAEDTRCDIYSFGAMLYEMLTGQPPYTGPSIEIILKRIAAGPPEPLLKLNPKASKDLVAIAEHAMGRELRDRYATMADVISDLDRAAQGKEPLGPHGRENGSHVRKKILAALGMVTLLGLAAIGLFKLPGRKDGSPMATPQDQFTWTTNDRAIAITKYTGYGGAVAVPSVINGLPVTSIGNEAFIHCRSLTSLTIPNSIARIGGAAFADCPSLVKVTIGKRVTSIGEGAFAGCSGLPNIAIPNNVTTVGDRAFKGCSLTNVHIPSSVTSMISPFDCCSRLVFISVDAANPAYCSTADGVLFNKDKTCLVNYPMGKGGSYVIPGGVTKIGESSFAGGAKLTSVTIPNTVTSIGSYAFYLCLNLTNVYFQGNAPSADWYIFLGADNATVYYLPETTGWGKEFAGRPTAQLHPTGAQR